MSTQHSDDQVRHHQRIPNYLINQYPDEASIDPVNAITKLLVEAGHPQPHKWLVGLDPQAVDPNLSQHERRLLVNKHWRPILGMVDDDDSSIPRYCLMDTGPMYTWLLLFKESVLPFVIKHNLPNINW
jgi:hypothetical protein